MRNIHKYLTNGMDITHGMDITQAKSGGGCFEISGTRTRKYGGAAAGAAINGPTA